MKKKQKASLTPPLPDHERWYQLKEHFDDQDYEATAIEGAFFRGPLKDVLIVEVPRDFPQQKFGELSQWLDTNGIEAMVVQEGIKFLKIAPATKDQNEVLEAHFEETKRKDDDPGPRGHEKVTPLDA